MYAWRKMFWLIGLATAACGSSVQFERALGTGRYPAMPPHVPIEIRPEVDDLPQPALVLGELRLHVTKTSTPQGKAEEALLDAAGAYGCDALAAIREERVDVAKKGKDDELEYQWVAKCVRTAKADAVAMASPGRARKVTAPPEPTPAEKEQKRLAAEAEKARKDAEKAAAIAAKKEKEAKAAAEAAEKERQRLEKAAAVKDDTERKRKEAEEELRKREAEQAERERKRKEADQAEKDRKDAEEKAKREAEATEKERKRKEAEADKAKKEADAKAKKDAEAAEKDRKKKEAEAEKAKKEAEDKARKEAEAAEKERKKKDAAAEKDRKAAEEKTKKDAEAADKKAKEEAAKKSADDKKTADERAKQQAEEKAKREADEKAKQQADEKAKRAAEDKAKAEAEQKAKDEAARKEADEKAKAEAEEKARKEAEGAGKKNGKEAKGGKPVDWKTRYEQAQAEDTEAAWLDLLNGMPEGEDSDRAFERLQKVARNRASVWLTTEPPKVSTDEVESAAIGDPAQLKRELADAGATTARFMLPKEYMQPWTLHNPTKQAVVIDVRTAGSRLVRQLDGGGSASGVLKGPCSPLGPPLRSKVGLVLEYRFGCDVAKITPRIGLVRPAKRDLAIDRKAADGEASLEAIAKLWTANPATRLADVQLQAVEEAMQRRGDDANQVSGRVHILDRAGPAAPLPVRVELSNRSGRDLTVVFEVGTGRDERLSVARKSTESIRFELPPGKTPDLKIKAAVPRLRSTDWLVGLWGFQGISIVVLPAPGGGLAAWAVEPAAGEDASPKLHAFAVKISAADVTFEAEPPGLIALALFADKTPAACEKRCALAVRIKLNDQDRFIAGAGRVLLASVEIPGRTGTFEFNADN